MVSWEEVVNNVVIPGNPAQVRAAAENWSIAFRNVGSARSDLDQALGVMDDMEGESADALRAHIEKIASGLADIQDHYSNVEVELKKGADALDAAIRAIPIPINMVAEIEQARADVRYGPSPGRLPLDYLTNAAMAFERSRVGRALDAMKPDMLRDWENGVRDAISPYADKAKEEYAKLRGQYEGVNLPTPTGYTPPGAEPGVDVDPEMPGGGLPSGGVPSTGTGGVPDYASVPTTGADPWTGVPGDQTGVDPVGYDPVNDPSAWDRPDSGLAGIGDGGGGGVRGLGPAGLDTGSAPGLGGGAGTRGLGSSLGTAGVGLGGSAGRGRTGAMPMGGIPMGAGGAGRGAGAGRGGGAGAGRRGVGGVGGVGGAGGRGGGTDGDPRYSWLTEDEDVWGVNSIDAPPSLLRRRPDPDDDW